MNSMAQISKDETVAFNVISNIDSSALAVSTYKISARVIYSLLSDD